MSDKVGGRKQTNVVTRQGTSREKEASSSDMSVYKSSAEQSVRNKEQKQSSLYKSSEEYFEYSCDPCKTAGDHVEAQGYCTNCKDYLCGTCFRSHSRSKTSKNHNLLDKDTMPKPAAKICDPCKTTGDEIHAAGYCQNCGDYLCDSCYKSHARSKTSRHHVLVDKDKMSEDSDLTPSIANLNIHDAGAGELRGNEAYDFNHYFNVKTNIDGYESCITGMALVSNTDLVLVDYYNHTLKLVDVETSIVKNVLVLQANPRGITTISKDQVAVTLTNVNRIQIISVRGRLNIASTVNTTGHCLDVDHSNGKLYVSLSNPVQFQILHLTGAIIKTIYPDYEAQTRRITPHCIAVSPDESLIYLSDRQTNQVLSMDMNGNMISLYQGVLDGPRDIAISPSGFVFFCNMNHNIVYKMTPDLREATIIQERRGGFVSPQALCFNADKQHLYISSGRANRTNFIYVYKWK